MAINISDAEIHTIVNEMTSAYDLDPPEVRIEDFDNMPHAMAKTMCYVNRDTNEANCVIIFRPCVLELRDGLRQEIYAHEVAHYINARVYGRYDHGRRWRQIVARFGYIPEEYYSEIITSQCDLTDP